MIEIKDGAVLRDGVTIGRIKEGRCTLINGTGKLAGRIAGQIRAAAGNPRLVFYEDKKWPIDNVNVMPTLVATKHGIERLFALVAAGEIPAPPPTHPQMGKITPAFVAWAKEHLTLDEYEREYGHRKLPTIEEVESRHAQQVYPHRKIFVGSKLGGEFLEDSN